jgi:arginyl-tRNA synthetase
MKHYISELITQSVQELFGQDGSQALATIFFDVSYPKSEFGDYATNAAMVLYKKLKDAPAGGPARLAGQLSLKIKELDHKQTFEKVENAGGFINFYVTASVKANQVAQMANKIVIAPDESGSKKVVFEYSSPNTNKPLHIGHTRNDTYGAACINLLKAIGHNVVTCEIINDRGIHIMKSVLMYIKHGEGKTPESENIKPDHFVGKYYVMFAEKASEGEAKEKELLAEAQELLRKWEAGDEEVRTVWKQMNSWWYEGVKQTYAREGSHFDEVQYESEVYDKGRDLVLAGVEKGVFTQEEDGSVSVDLTEAKLDKKYLLRKDGTTIYITQDMYLWDLRNQKHHPDLAIVTTAAEQSYHFAVLAKLFELLAYPWAQNFKHLPYEHVYLGKDKMSSRGGNTISADDLLAMIKDRIREAMKGLDKIKGTTDDEKLVEQIAFGAIKYGYLKYEPNTRIYFDPEQTIALEGNTGPYIQYAHARIRSIMSKAGQFEHKAPEHLFEPAELELVRWLQYYQEKIVLDAALEYKPNLLCHYLFELASKFSTFYNAVSVLGTEDVNLRNQRLTLLIAAANTIEHGLGILGITAPKEM